MRCNHLDDMGISLTLSNTYIMIRYMVGYIKLCFLVQKNVLFYMFIKHNISGIGLLSCSNQQ